MPPNPSNKNAIKNVDNVDIDLKLHEDENRTWVDKDRFPEFDDGYNDSQENSSLSNSSQVQFRIITTIKDTDTEEEKQNLHLLK